MLGNVAVIDSEYCELAGTGAKPGNNKISLEVEGDPDRITFRGSVDLRTNREVELLTV